MEQSVTINLNQASKKPSFLIKLYCHFFGHTAQRKVIEDDQLITRYICKHCNRRLGNGLRKSLPVPNGIDQNIWHNYMQELMESYKRYEGVSKGRRSRKG